MDSLIIIEEKPACVSWDAIHEVLTRAHSDNFAKGINMRKPLLPGEEIRKEIGDDGVMLVALDGNIVVGTAALLVKQSRSWYNKGRYGYLCFGAILPEYSGKGIYRLLCNKREEIARSKGLDKLYFDTHHNNKHVIEINQARGFRCVSTKLLSDHWNIVLFKWLDGCPFSDSLISRKFYISEKLAEIQYKQGIRTQSWLLLFFCKVVKVLFRV